MNRLHDVIRRLTRRRRRNVTVASASLALFSGVVALGPRSPGAPASPSAVVREDLFVDAMIHLAGDRGWSFDTAPRKNAEPATSGSFAPVQVAAQKSAGIEFTERMSGFIAPEPALPYETAFAKGKTENRPFSFKLRL